MKNPFGCGKIRTADRALLCNKRPLLCKLLLIYSFLQFPRNAISNRLPYAVLPEGNGCRYIPVLPGVFCNSLGHAAVPVFCFDGRHIAFSAIVCDPVTSLIF